MYKYFIPAISAFAIMLLSASAAEAHRTSYGVEERNQYLRLVCEATATTPSTDPDQRYPVVSVGEVCRVAPVDRSAVVTFDTHPNRQRHETSNSQPHRSGEFSHDNPRYRWIVQSDCSGNPQRATDVSIPSGGSYGNPATYFAAAGENETYTVQEADLGKCIYALVYFDRDLHASGLRLYHATINQFHNTNSGMSTSQFDARVRVLAAGSPASGEPRLRFASGISAPTEDSRITADGHTINEPNGIDISTIEWQWQSADVPTDGMSVPTGMPPADGDYEDISGATASGTTSSTFTPGDNEAGRFLRLCMSFDDRAGNDEGKFCTSGAAVVNVNDEPEGVPYLVDGMVVDSGTFSADSPTAPASLTEDDLIATVLSTSGSAAGTDGGGPVMDDDGVPLKSSKTWRQSIQSGSSASGPWVERTNKTANQNPTWYALVQEDVNRGWVRSCAFYVDGHGTLEGAPAGSTADDHNNDHAMLDEEDRLNGSLCSVPVRVNNLNDAPVAVDSLRSVAPGASRAFVITDFDYEDEDNDALASITIASLPGSGSLTVSGAAATVGQTVMAADIGTLAYSPAGSAADGDADSFEFSVTDDGMEPDADTNTSSANNATFTLSITSTNIAATGMPALAYADGISAPTEDSAITASAGDIADSDGLGALGWQWQQADINGGEYSDIGGATSAAFTPLQVHVGKFLRVCASFTDAAMNDERLCRQMADAVANVNDAPEGRPQIVGNNADLGYAVGDPAPSVLENTLLSVYGAGMGSLMDEDGIPAAAAITISWQSGSDSDGWMEIDSHSADGSVDGTLSFDDSDLAAGGMVRICYFYTDGGNNPEGGDSSSQSGREAGSICSAPVPIVNTNTRPVTTDGSRSNLEVTLTHRFNADNFSFSDADSPADAWTHLIISTLPTAGTLSYDGTDIATDDLPYSVAVGNIGDLLYTPASNAGHGSSATFTFQVMDDGDDLHPLAETASSNLITEAYDTVSAAATFTIRIKVTPNTLASGKPIVASAFGDLPGGFYSSPGTVIVGTRYSSGTFTLGGTTGGGFIFDRDGTANSQARNAHRVIRSWQRRDGSGWAEIQNEDRASGWESRHDYTVQAADFAARQIRVCAFFYDDLGRLEGGDISTQAGREGGRLCSDAVWVDTRSASGALSVTDAAGTDFGSTGPLEGAELSADAAGISDPDGIDSSTIAWRWQSAPAAMGGGAPAGMDYVDIEGATSASYTPGDGDVRDYLRLFYSFADNVGDSSAIAYTFAHPVVNVDVPATGTPALASTDSSGDNITASSITTIAQGGYLLTGLSTGGGTVADPEIQMSTTPIVKPAYWRQSIQRASDPINGPWDGGVHRIL